MRLNTGTCTLACVTSDGEAVEKEIKIMAITSSDFKTGLTLNIDGNPWIVLDFQHVKPGKGAAFVRTKLKNLRTGAIVEQTFNSGIKVENVELKDISLTDEMKRVIARAAEAEREKQAVITKSKGEVEAANNLAEAATTLAQSPGALHLRTLETINDVSSDQSNTIFFAMPIEVLDAIKGIGEAAKNKNNK